MISSRSAYRFYGLTGLVASPAISPQHVIDLLKVYAQIWVLFGNANPTRIINIHLYTLGFVTHEYGKTSALGIMVLVVVTLFTLLVLRWSRRSV